MGEGKFVISHQRFGMAHGATFGVGVTVPFLFKPLAQSLVLITPRSATTSSPILPSLCLLTWSES